MSVEIVQLNITEVIDETEPGVCVVELAVGSVGLVVSTTLTVLVTCVAAFPDVSDTL